MKNAVSKAYCKDNEVVCCVVCKKPVDWTHVKEEFGNELFAQAHALGMESLTEQQQAVLEGLVCSLDCYDYLQ